jgi:hypothetical protein
MVTCDIHQWGHLSDDDLGPLGIDYYCLYYCSPFPLNYIIVPLIVLWIIFLIKEHSESVETLLNSGIVYSCFGN